jgi:hypothetical protein
MITLVEDLYFFKKNRDVKNLRLSSNRCSLGNFGGMTSSSSCKGEDGLITHLSWNRWFCCVHRAYHSPCVTLRCGNTFAISLASVFIVCDDCSNLGGIKRGLHVGLKKSGSIHAASRAIARWAWIIGDSISGTHSGFVGINSWIYLFLNTSISGYVRGYEKQERDDMATTTPRCPFNVHLGSIYRGSYRWLLQCM